jgi:amino acid adenylation domain-containing protein/thioester reductase-like protein
MCLTRIDKPEHLASFFQNLSKHKNIPILLYIDNDNKPIEAELAFHYKTGDQPLIKTKEEIPSLVSGAEIKIHLFYRDNLCLIESKVLQILEKSFLIHKPSEINISCRRQAFRHKMEEGEKAFVRFNTSNHEYSISDISFNGFSFISKESIFFEGQTVKNVKVSIENGPDFLSDGIIKNIARIHEGSYKIGVYIVSISLYLRKKLFSYLFRKNYPFSRELADYSDLAQLYDESKYSVETKDNDFLSLLGILERMKRNPLLSANLVYDRNGTLALCAAIRVYNRTFLGQSATVASSDYFPNKIKNELLLGLVEQLLNNPYFSDYIEYVNADDEWRQSLYNGAGLLINNKDCISTGHYFLYQWRTDEALGLIENSIYSIEELYAPDDEFINFCNENLNSLETDCYDYRKDRFNEMEARQLFDVIGISVDRKLWKISKGGVILAFAVADGYSDEISLGNVTDNCRIHFTGNPEEHDGLLKSFLSFAATFYKRISRESFNLFVRTEIQQTIPGIIKKQSIMQVIMNWEGLNELKKILSADILTLDKYYPLTYPQKLIWYSEKLYPGTSLGNNAGTARVKGGLDFTLLEKAVNIFIQKNDSIRLRMIEKEGEIKQYIAEYRVYKLNFVDFSNLNELNPFYDWEKKTTEKVFNLIDSDLFYFANILLPKKESSFYIKMHHTISDAWATILAFHQIFEIYWFLKQNKPIPSGKSSSYLDYLDRENDFFHSDRFYQYQDFWNNQFQTVPEFIHWKNQKQKGFSTRSSRIGISLFPNLSKKVNNFCNEKEISIFSLFLCLIGIYISRATSKKDISIGTSVLNRLSAKEKETIGMFTNMLPIHLSIDMNMPFLEFLDTFGRQWKQILKYQKYPYLSILRDARERLGVNDLFDVTFTYQNAKLDIDSFVGEYQGRWHSYGHQTNSLNIFLNDREGDGNYVLNFDYLIDIFTINEIEQIAKHIFNLLEDVLENPLKKISEIEILNKSEKVQILNDFNNTKADFPFDKTVHQLFMEQAAKTPDNIAVVFNNQNISYRELDERSNQLARSLRNKGVKPDSLVGIMVEPSIEMVIGIISIIKASGAYLPIDTDYPQERIEYMLSDSKAQILLSRKNFLNKIPENLRNSALALFFDDPSIYQEDNSPIPNVNTPNDLIYLIYTSGSTGKPKGVLVNQIGLVNLIHTFKEMFSITSSDKVSQVSNFTFDASVFEIFPCLTAGATLFIIKKEITYNPNLLKEFINSKKITFTYQPTAIGKILFTYDWTNTNLRNMCVAGERLSQYKMNDLPFKVYNLYGPTETTVWATYYLLKKPGNDEAPPIGQPIKNTKIYIVDPHNRLQPIGFEGELCISGTGLARGYLNNPDLTAQKFVPNPFIPGELMYRTGDMARWLPDGNIGYIGRIDHQVKIRGFRIELGEVENRMLETPGVKETAVLAREDSDGEKFLCAYYSGEKELDITVLKAALSRGMPEYMVPSRFVYLEKFPLTSNGKLDRKALPEPDEASIVRKEYIAPRDEIERTIALIFQETLKIEKVGLDDNFFDLGVNSIMLIKIQGKLFDKNLGLTLQDYYRYPTVREIAALARGEIKREGQNEEINIYQKKNEANFTADNFNLEDENNTAVLITGVTGYLGAHVLKKFLNKTKAFVYCLVRGKNKEEAEDRLISTINYYFSDNYKIDILQRTKVIVGDVSLERLGLSEKEYTALGNNIDSIIHTAAAVKHKGNYQEIAAINIDGVKNVVELAKKFNKNLHYISTLSVSGDFISRHKTKKALFTENDFFIGQDYHEQVYMKTKFLAENYLFFEREKGLKAAIYRLGNLSERHTDGCFQQNIPDNLIHSVMKSIINSGIVPSQAYSVPFDLTPVDFCAEALIGLISRKGAMGGVYHVYNTKRRDFGNILKEMASFMGKKLEIMKEPSFRDYVQKLIGKKIPEPDLDVIKEDFNFEKILSDDYRVEVQSKITEGVLKKIGFNWPDIDASYISRIIKHWKKVGFM